MESAKLIHKTLKDTGLSDAEITQVLQQVEEILYEDVVDKIIDGLDDTHYAGLDRLMREGKSSKEIVETLPVNEEWFNELYMKTLDEYLNNLQANKNLLSLQI